MPAAHCIKAAGLLWAMAARLRAHAAPIWPLAAAALLLGLLAAADAHRALPGPGKEWGPNGIRACRRGYAKRSPRNVPCSLCDSKRTSFASRLGLKACQRCPAVRGKVSTDRTKCIPRAGYTGGRNGLPTPCRAGTAKGTLSFAPCDLCNQPNQYQPKPGAPACLTCVGVVVKDRLGLGRGCLADPTDAPSNAPTNAPPETPTRITRLKVEPSDPDATALVAGLSANITGRLAYDGADNGPAEGRTVYCYDLNTVALGYWGTAYNERTFTVTLKNLVAGARRIYCVISPTTDQSTGKVYSLAETTFGIFVEPAPPAAPTAAPTDGPTGPPVFSRPSIGL